MTHYKFYPRSGSSRADMRVSNGARADAPRTPLSYIRQCVHFVSVYVDLFVCVMASSRRDHRFSFESDLESVASRGSSVRVNAPYKPTVSVMFLCLKVFVTICRMCGMSVFYRSYCN